MKKDNPNVCPGCSKHCTAETVRCKRGQRYFAQLKAAEIPSSFTPGKFKDSRQSKKRKWERHVTEEGLLWQLLSTSRMLKKRLRDGVQEDELLFALTDEERGQLEVILRKIRPNFKKS